MTEFELLDVLLAELKQEFSPDELGPGDDCAIIPLNVLCSADRQPGSLLVSSDMLLDQVHFRRDWSSPADIAWKALAVNESDIAAMGGVPLGFTLSIGCPSDMVESGFLRDLYVGFSDYLKKQNLKLYGGDLACSEKLTISVTVLGTTLRNGLLPLKRSGARPGDVVWVSGEIGLAGLGLKILENESASLPLGLDSETRERALLRHRRPDPRTALAQFLAASKDVRSMIDISDGLFQDVSHIARLSDVSILLFPDMMPVPVLHVTAGSNFGPAFYGSAGDDYELLFTADPSFRPASVTSDFSKITPIGRVLPRGEDALNVARGVVDIFSSSLDNSRGFSSMGVSSLAQYLEEEGYQQAHGGFNHF